MAKKRRVKSDKDIVTVSDFKHADELIKEIGLAQQAIEHAERIATNTINRLKQSKADAVKPHQEKIRQLTESLQYFCDQNKEAFGRQKSKKLNFGVLGWRKSSQIKTKKTTLAKIKEFFVKGLQKKCIRIKETVDKDGLKRLTDEQLKMVDARREERDVFFAEPDKEELADYET